MKTFNIFLIKNRTFSHTQKKIPRVTMHPTGARQAAIPAAAAGGSKNMFLGGERRRSRRQLLLLLHYNPISSAQKVQLKLY